MTRIIKEIFSLLFNNYNLTIKYINVYEKASKADFQSASEIHYHKVNMMKLG